MLRSRHLRGRYDKFDFFCSFLFYYWVAQYFRGNDKDQQNRENNNTWNSLPNIFLLKIFIY